MKSLVTKPGQFKAVCRLGYWTPDLEALMESGADTTVSKWDRKLERNVFLAQCSEEFTDRTLFDSHMRDVHHKRKSSGDLTPWSQDIDRGWRAPKLKDEGQPFKPSTKDLARDIETCGTCGLVAEVGGRAADVRWWDEHVRGCALAAAS